MGREEKMLSFTWMIVSGDRRQQRGPWGRDMGTWGGGVGGHGTQDGGPFNGRRDPEPVHREPRGAAVG